MTDKNMLRSFEEIAAALITAGQAGEADIILVQPPFASPDRPSLGLHILQQIAATHGVNAVVIYANLAFARAIGPLAYRELCHTPTEQLVGERIFQRAWHGAANRDESKPPECWEGLANLVPPFAQMQNIACQWAETMAKALSALPAPVFGFSSTFEQTASSMALITALKRRSPDKTVLVGGANTDGPMGVALAEIAPQVDHVFQGEAEASFAAFLTSRKDGKPSPRIIAGEVNFALDDVPAPVYADYFAQWAVSVDEAIVPRGISRREIRLPYESSRGCWWGAKHHCTFCGLNANGMTHRAKSPDKVAREIHALSDRAGVDRILMTDNIMPHGYFSTLLPQLAAAERKLEIFYEQKANLNRERMTLLREAGVTSIQPGIESLSTSLLRRMRKGTSLQINLQCLRYARAVGITIAWNLLSDFPGDTDDDYEAMLAFLPALHHLEPPSGLGGLSIERFSPYFESPEKFGITNIQPLPAYAEVFPGADQARLAYHFEAEYESSLRRNRGLKERLEAALKDWTDAWAGEPPLVHVFELGSDRHLLVDTRLIHGNGPQLIDDRDARLLLSGANLPSERVLDWVGQNLLIAADESYLPVACAALDAPYWD